MYPSCRLTGTSADNQLAVQAPPEEMDGPADPVNFFIPAPMTRTLPQEVRVSAFCSFPRSSFLVLRANIFPLKISRRPLPRFLSSWKMTKARTLKVQAPRHRPQRKLPAEEQTGGGKRTGEFEFKFRERILSLRVRT